jgi:hypothetical protein
VQPAVLRDSGSAQQPLRGASVSPGMTRYLAGSHSRR